MKKKVFEEFLRQRGLRFTREREAIVDDVMGRKGHFDPEELYLSLRGKDRRVSRASVYRTLPLMLEAGIVEQVERSDKQTRYERTIGVAHHDHMLCVSCGKVIEFYSEGIERLQDEICRVHGFAGVSHSLEITGYCRRCARSRG